MVVIEMGKLSKHLKKSVESMSWLEAWSIFFNFADKPKYRKLVNNLIMTKEEINMASELLMEISQDEKERAHLRSRRMFETDMTSNLLTAESRGEKRGERRGRKKGRDEGRVEIIKLLRSGVSLDEVEKRFKR